MTLDELRKRIDVPPGVGEDWPSREIMLALCDVAKAAQETVELYKSIGLGTLLVVPLATLSAALASPELTPEQEERR